MSDPERIRLTQLSFDDLDAPPVVLGSRNWITPAAELEALFFPQPSWFLDAIHEKIVPLKGHQPTTNQTLGEGMTRKQVAVDLAYLDWAPVPGLNVQLGKMPYPFQRVATPTWDPAWSRFAGLYRGRGGDSQVVELNKRLVIINPAAANLDNPITLEPIGNGQFRYVAPTGGGPVGETVRFVEENGRVTRMITGDSFVERVQQ